MVCNVCGKEVKYPKSKSHTNSKFHQAALARKAKPTERVNIPRVEAPKPKLDTIEKSEKPKKHKARKIHIDKQKTLDTLEMIGTVIVGMLFLMGIPAAITLVACYFAGDITMFFPLIFFVQAMWIFVLYVIFCDK